MAESSTPRQGETRTPDSFEKERVSLRNRIAELQAQLSTEQRYREEAEQEFQKLKGTDSSRQEKINNLQSRLTEQQDALDSLKARYASQEQQLKKFSEEAQRRLDRARTNYLARRWQRYPAPDGSNRNFVIVYDENGPDILPPKVRARFEAGQ